MRRPVSRASRTASACSSGARLAEQVDLGVLPDDLGAVGALVEARDAVQVVDRHPLGVAPGRPAERELERVEALVGALAGPAHLDPVEHVALERDAVDDAERRGAVPGPHVDVAPSGSRPGCAGRGGRTRGSARRRRAGRRPCASRGPCRAARARPAGRSPRRRRPGSPASRAGSARPCARCSDLCGQRCGTRPRRPWRSSFGRR